MIKDLARSEKVGSGYGDLLTERDVLSCIARVLGVCDFGLENGDGLRGTDGGVISRTQLDSAYQATVNRFVRSLTCGWLEDFEDRPVSRTPATNTDPIHADLGDTADQSREVDGPNPEYDTERAFSESEAQTVEQVLAYVRHDPAQNLALRQEATLVAATLGMLDLRAPELAVPEQYMTTLSQPAFASA